MKLILDLDTGIDDAMALAYAVGSPDLELNRRNGYLWQCVYRSRAYRMC